MAVWRMAADVMGDDVSFDDSMEDDLVGGWYDTVWKTHLIVRLLTMW